MFPSPGIQTHPAPLVVWFTGLSGSGKTTICTALADVLTGHSIPVAVLDADVFRHAHCRDLGFSPHDRRENLRRLSREASRLCSSASVVLVAAISPYRDIRAEVRSHHSRFIEVFVNAPLAVCESRDPKGLYRSARAGSIPDFTGISAPYEEPLHPDVECKSDRETVAESSNIVLRAIKRTLIRKAEPHTLAAAASPSFQNSF